MPAFARVVPTNPVSVFGVLHRLGAGEIALDEAAATSPPAAGRCRRTPTTASSSGCSPATVQALHDRRINDEQYEALQEARGPIVQRE